MICQYLLYRKTESGAQLVFLSLFPLEVGYFRLGWCSTSHGVYTYEPETPSLWAWHERLIDLQGFLGWAIAVLGAIALIWALFRFSRWLTGRILRKHASAA